MKHDLKNHNQSWNDDLLDLWNVITCKLFATKVENFDMFVIRYRSSFRRPINPRPGGQVTKHVRTYNKSQFPPAHTSDASLLSSVSSPLTKDDENTLVRRLDFCYDALHLQYMGVAQVGSSRYQISCRPPPNNIYRQLIILDFLSCLSGHACVLCTACCPVHAVSPWSRVYCSTGWAITLTTLTNRSYLSYCPICSIYSGYFSDI
jgi:hypothetical protein